MGKFTPLSVSTTLILLSVLLTTEMGSITVEGKTCDVLSVEYSGMVCVNNIDCNICCQHEGAESGKCKGFFFRCICTKPC
ncbi:hypothetical protein GQ457_17G024610 [Hibiscus cannabinus]